MLIRATTSNIWLLVTILTINFGMLKDTIKYEYLYAGLQLLNQVVGY